MFQWKYYPWTSLESCRETVALANGRLPIKGCASLLSVCVSSKLICTFPVDTATLAIVSHQAPSDCVPFTLQLLSPVFGLGPFSFNSAGSVTLLELNGSDQR